MNRKLFLENARNKLAVGQILSNKELMELVGTVDQNHKYKEINKIPSITKKCLLKRLDAICKYLEFKKDNKLYYKILEVYPAPKALNDNRLKDKKGYNKLIANILPVLIAQNKDNRLVVNINYLMYCLGIVNKNFINRKYSKREVIELLKDKDIDYSNYLIFCATLENGFNGIVSKALRKLKNDNIINYNNTNVLRIDTPKDVVVIEKIKYLEASHKLNKQINYLENKLIKKSENEQEKLDLREKDLYTKVVDKLYAELKEYTNNIIHYEHFIKSYFKAYAITNIKEVTEETKEAMRLNRVQLNALAKNYMLANAINEKTYKTKVRAINKIDLKEGFGLDDVYMQKYIEDCVKLINIYMQLQS